MQLWIAAQINNFIGNIGVLIEITDFSISESELFSQTLEEELQFIFRRNIWEAADFKFLCNIFAICEEYI